MSARPEKPLDTDNDGLNNDIDEQILRWSSLPITVSELR